jgi:ACS family hexuronate transporter-like MFS transporter
VALALVVFCIHTCWHLFRVWLPKFMQEGRGYSENEALAFNSIFYIATDIGCLAAGAVTVWLNRRLNYSPHRARVWVYAGCATLTTASLLVFVLPRGPMLLAALLVVAAGSLGLFPCYYSFVQELSDRHAGKFIGILGTWVWASSSPVHKYFGRLIDRTHSFDLGMALAGVAPLIGLAILWLLWSRHEVNRPTS